MTSTEGLQTHANKALKLKPPTKFAHARTYIKPSAHIQIHVYRQIYNLIKSA